MKRVGNFTDCSYPSAPSCSSWILPVPRSNSLRIRLGYNGKDSQGMLIPSISRDWKWDSTHYFSPPVTLYAPKAKLGMMSASIFASSNVFLSQLKSGGGGGLFPDFNFREIPSLSFPAMVPGGLNFSWFLASLRVLPHLQHLGPNASWCLPQVLSALSLLLVS